VRFPAVPSPSPGLSPPAAPGPSRQSSRRPAALLPFAVAGTALCVVIALVVGVVALVSKTPSARSGNHFSVEQQSGPARDETSEPAPPPQETVPPTPEPEDVPAVAAPSPKREDGRDVEPAEWPPARAFTARCRAPSGACAPECTELAGGRCLDPCFIHTPDCSKDCLKPDGTCGWPPPDAE
jgi:hypothetical protein